jgi:nucleotide-binding universal stress UspA family protein
VTIVVGYVPKPEGEAALERAVAEAQLRSEDLVVVNSTSGGAYADASWATDEQLAGVRQQVEAAGVPYELVHAVVGREPADHLVEVVEKAHASLLVIGLRRRTSVGKFLLGSSASVILMHAPCPVLAVKAPGGEHWPHR